MLTPGLYMGLVYLSSQLFKVDPIFLIGRAVALTSLAQLLSAGIGCIVLVIRSQDTWQDKFALLKNIVLNNAFFKVCGYIGQLLKKELFQNLLILIFGDVYKFSRQEASLRGLS